MPISRQDSASSSMDEVLARKQHKMHEGVSVPSSKHHQSGFPKCVEKKGKHFCSGFAGFAAIFYFECRRAYYACQHKPYRQCPTTCLITCTQPVDASHPVGGSPSHRDICGPFRPIRFHSPGAFDPNTTQTHLGIQHTPGRTRHIAASELLPPRVHLPPTGQFNFSPLTDHNNQ